MSKVPTKPEDIFEEITSDFKNLFGDNLVSIILYGSGARGDYIAGKSDINLLIATTEGIVALLDETLAIVAKWKKRSVAVPLFMTNAFIASSRDSYPVEFLNMKLNHAIIYGQDVLATLSFDARDLRLQLEREFKGKVLHLQTAYFETDGKPKEIRRLIQISFKAFVALFNAMLFLKDKAVPPSKAELVDAVSNLFCADADILLQCAAITDGRDDIPPSQMPDIFRRYLKEVEALSVLIDSMIEHQEI